MSRSNENAFSLAYLCRLFKQALLNHIQQLLLDFDPVKDGQKLRITREELLYSKLQQSTNSIRTSSSKTKINSIFLLPAASMLAISLESQFLYFKSRFDKQSDAVNQVIARRIFPSSIWKQSDVMMVLAHLLTTTIFLLLLFDDQLESKFVMYLFKVGSDKKEIEIIQNGRILGPAETTLIVRYRTSMNRRVRWIILILFLLLAAFFGSSFLQTAESHKLSNQVYLLKLVEMVFIILYLPLSNVFLILYFLLVVRYIRIKQKCLQKRILQLETVASSLEDSEFQHSHQQKMSRLWRAFKSLNLNLTAIHEEIRGQNRLWSKYLSLYFAIYIMEICFFSYTIFFVSNSSSKVFGKLIFATFGLEFMVLLLFITLECSKVVTSNKRSHLQLGRIVLSFSQSERFLSVFELLKLDQAAARGRDVASVCFKLVNGYRINSQMFQLVRMSFIAKAKK